MLFFLIPSSFLSDVSIRLKNTVEFFASGQNVCPCADCGAAVVQGLKQNLPFYEAGGFDPWCSSQVSCGQATAPCMAAAFIRV